MVNSELKVIIYDERSTLQELLDLLDEQYEIILTKELIKIDKIAKKIDCVSKTLANIELKRRSLLKSDKKFSQLVEECDDTNIKETFGNMKLILKTIEVQKDINATLIKQQLFFTKKMINMIKPSKKMAIYNSYGKIEK